MTRRRTWLVLGLFAASMALMPACGGSSGGGSSGGQVLPPGSFKILTGGGVGFTGHGGDGNYIEILSDGGSDIRILRGGTVDASFTVPTTAPDLGPNPLTVTSDMTVTPMPLGATTARLIGDDGFNDATGLRVLPGVTLTIRGNYDSDNSDGDGNNSTGTKERAYLDFTYCVLIEGTITGHQDDNPGDGLRDNALAIDLDCDTFITTATSVIDLVGEDGAPGSGMWGDGGDFDVGSDGAIITRGRIDLRGGSGDTGARGGDLELDAEYGMYNTGVIDTSGGLGLTGDGGNAGSVELYSEDTGPMMNSGPITARGGDGQKGGGTGGEIDLYTDDVGGLVNGGAIDSSGGDCVGTNGHGGSAGDIVLDVHSGSMRAAGSYTARGGNGAGTGEGGEGNYIEFYVDYSDYIEENYQAGSLYLGANIDARGGDGAAGGEGGDVIVEMEYYDPVTPGMHEVVLMGYAEFNTSGGNGAVNGGAAGYGLIEQENGEDDSDMLYIGSIYNEVPWIMRGGDGTAGWGGNGGEMDIDDDDYYATPDYDRTVVNVAPFDMRGGDGATDGGDGGDFFMYGYYQTRNTGAIDTSGGTGDSEEGGRGGDIEILSDGICFNQANLTGNGGSTTVGPAGSGADIYIEGRETTCVGVLTARGGNCANGTGGGGGYVEVYSTEHASTLSGSAHVAPGLGTPPGKGGAVWLDGVRAALTGGFVGF
ncbi:MAG: hypothetical protein QNJ98_20220 [Planctomycetota bacterium]|nr:hypothetical protein [Planctomycetota bacterium]